MRAHFEQLTLPCPSTRPHNTPMSIDLVSADENSDLREGAQRPQCRQFAGTLIITTAVALALGVVLRQPSLMAANDISRWCTVWSLLERGTYIIDECPWQAETQDKVLIATLGNAVSTAENGASPVRHYYSSKPAFLSTLIAGVLYPVRLLSGIPLDRAILIPKSERYVAKPDPANPSKTIPVLETPEPLKWPVYGYYFKPVLILFNVLPFAVFLILFARMLDREPQGDWAWLFSLVSASWGTFLLPFCQTLNNHTVAAFSAFFGLYQFWKIWDEGERSWWRFAAVGFFAAFAAANELPAYSFLAFAGALLLWRFPIPTLRAGVPAVLIPLLFFVVCQWIEFGKFRLPYTEFGTESYEYEGSFWSYPLELDALNKPEHRESYPTYFFHLTLGHHGLLSLTPIFAFSLIGCVRLMKRRGGPLSAIARMTAVLTVVVLGYYSWNPQGRNYGGSTQGLRWMFWLIPFWLITLSEGLRGGDDRRWLRGLSILALAVSVISVGYAMRNPWTHPWLLDLLERLNLYPLVH